MEQPADHKHSICGGRQGRTTVVTASKEEQDLNESSHVMDLGAPLATTALSSLPLHEMNINDN